MSEPSVPPNASEVKSVVDTALHGLQLDFDEVAAVLNFADSELSHLQTSETAYFVLGSYRDPYLRRLRTVENELNKRVSAYAFIMGDLQELGLDSLPEFRVRFHLLAEYADYIIGVYEQDSGGEVTELGKISETPYFEKAYVLPRDYCWMTSENFDGKADVVAATMAICRNDDLTGDEKDGKIESLRAKAHESGIDVSEEELLDAVHEREGDGTSYSWVHLNEFRLFELHDRCRPWVEESELRHAVDVVPKPNSHPDWETE